MNHTKVVGYSITKYPNLTTAVPLSTFMIGMASDIECVLICIKSILETLRRDGLLVSMFPSCGRSRVRARPVSY